MGCEILSELQIYTVQIKQCSNGIISSNYEVATIEYITVDRVN